MQESEKQKDMKSHTNPQVLIEWEAPTRPFKKPGKKIIRFYLALALLLSLFVVFFSETILLIPIWATLFLFYTLTITPAHSIKHRVTKFGLESADVTVRWDAMAYFYFTNKFSYTILTVVSLPPYNHHMFFVVPDDEIKQSIIDILSEHVIYKEDYQKTFAEKMVDALGKLVPDDEEGVESNVERSTSADVPADKQKPNDHEG